MGISIAKHKRALASAAMAVVLVAGLAVCKISLEQWWKTCWKWWLLMSVVCIGFTTVSAMLPVA